MELLKKRKSMRSKTTRLANPFAKTETSPKEPLKSLQHLKLSFPMFEDGDGVAEWLQDCEQYFTMFKIGEYKKVPIAGMHLKGTARNWFQVDIVGKVNLEWTDFCNQMMARFGEWEQELLDDNFKKLQQTSIVNSYSTQFKEYSEQLNENMPVFIMTHEEEMFSLENSEQSLEEKSEIMSAISENQMVDSGHHFELRPPKFKTAGVFESLQDYEHHWAVKPIYDEELGESQDFWPECEVILAALGGGNSDSPYTLQNEICTSEILDKLAESSIIQDLQQGNGHSKLRYEMTPIQLEEVASMIPTSREIVKAVLNKRIVKDFPTAKILYDLGMRSSNFGMGNMLIFDPGGQVHKPLQFKGFCNSNITKVLIDGGSTLNLVSASLCDSLGLSTEPITSIFLKLPNGGTLECASKCSDFKFKLNEEEFQVEVWKTELPEWDLILRVQWLSQLGELHCNYKMQTLQFEWHGKKIKLITDSTLELVGSCHQFTVVIPRWIEHICGSYEVEEKQDANEEVFPIILTNMGNSDEAFEKFPTVKNSDGLGKKSGQFSKTNVLVFDPGGYKQDNQSTCVVKMLKEMIRNEVKVEEVSLANSDYGQTQEHPEFVDQIVKSVIHSQVIPKFMVMGYGINEMDRVMGYADHDASRKSVSTIFDPGGKIIRVGGIVQKICRSANLIHEDMDAFKGEGLSGSLCLSSLVVL